MRILHVVIVVTILLSMIGTTSSAETISWTLPPATGVLDYQLGDTYDALPDGTPIDVVARDVTAVPLAGAYNICYINGFQTQTDTLDTWLALPTDVLLRDANGDPVADPDWPDEYILDPSSAAQREAILGVIGPQISSCAQAGFDAVEFDNLDTFTRFSEISVKDALALADAYIKIAHEYGLAVGQKNTAELLLDDGTIPAFDFAVAESCAVWGECQLYTAAYSDHVLQIEYPVELAEAGMSFADVCDSENRAPLTILRDRDLVGPGDPTYVYDRCPGLA